LDWWKISLRGSKTFRDFCDGRFNILVEVCMGYKLMTFY